MADNERDVKDLGGGSPDDLVAMYAESPMTEVAPPKLEVVKKDEKKAEQPKSKAKRKRANKPKPAQGATVKIVNDKPKFEFWQKKNDKVCLVGTATSIVNTPWMDKSYDFWPLQVATAIQGYRYSDDQLLFELHDERYFDITPGVKERMNKLNLPTLMQKEYDWYPKAMSYPLTHMRKKYRTYFTSSIAYMIALAVEMEYKHIALFGIHMASSEEYTHQKGACEYWLGVAEGRGADVFIAPESEVLKSVNLYAYEPLSEAANSVYKRLVGLQNGVQELMAREEEIRNMRVKTQGALSEAQTIFRSLSGGAKMGDTK